MPRFCLRLLLLATTARPGISDPWRHFRSMADGLRAAGWSVRAAAPRYRAVWAGATHACRTLRVVVLPARSRDLSVAEADAYLRARLHRLGLADHPPSRDDADLASAERKLWAALAPQLLHGGGALDIVASERPRPPWT